MKTIIKNDYKLTDDDITDFTTKVKVLLINDNNEIILAYADNEYQFPGGTVEENESLSQTLIREIEEETGIIIENLEYPSFFVSKGYYKNWPEVNRNKLVSIYYFKINTSANINLDNMNLTDNEKKKNFELKKIKLNDLIQTLKDNVVEYGDKHGIAREMLEMLEISEILI